MKLDALKKAAATQNRVQKIRATAQDLNISGDLADQAIARVISILPNWDLSRSENSISRLRTLDLDAIIDDAIRDIFCCGEPTDQDRLAVRRGLDYVLQRNS